MRATTRRSASRPVSRLHPTLSSPVRKDALAWVADAADEWRLPDGSPNPKAIGPDMGISPSTLYRIIDDPDWPLASGTGVTLVIGAAKAHGIPYTVAYHRIFRDPTVPLRRDNWFAKAKTPGQLVEAFAAHVAAFTATDVLETADAA